MSRALISARASADLPLAAGSGSGASPALGARSEPFQMRTPTPAARTTRTAVVRRYMVTFQLSQVIQTARWNQRRLHRTRNAPRLRPEGAPDNSPGRKPWVHAGISPSALAPKG